MRFLRHIVPRLNGDLLEKEYPFCRELVRRGIAGFILFGGELGAVRHHLRMLQDAAERPLMIAADCEQGLGQQVDGGTLFPPAMAVTSAARRNGDVDVDLVRRVFTVYAEEALHAGINTILAPVADINTNPDNPIISVRAFGEDRTTVSLMTGLMVETLQAGGVRACAKHFPGHGDTAVDSHCALPVLDKGLDDIEREELSPFRNAIAKGVAAVMLAHLAVPALDPRGTPMSVSEPAVRFLRERMGYKGLLMTDALDMGGLASLGEKGAGAAALRAGVDVLLHPADPLGLDEYLTGLNRRPSPKRIDAFRSGLSRGRDNDVDFRENARFAANLTEASLRRLGGPWKGTPSSIVILREEDSLARGVAEQYLRNRFPGVKEIVVSSRDVPPASATGQNPILVLYSRTAAWKGGPDAWFRDAVRALVQRAGLCIVFGNPYAIHGAPVPAITTFWCSEQAEHAFVSRAEDMLGSQGK